MVAAKKSAGTHLPGQGVTGRSSRRLRVIVLEPVALYRDCLIRVLRAHFGRGIEILGVELSLSGVRQMLMQVECVDALIGAPYGARETLLDWERFGRLLGRHYPDLACLMWTSLPVRFVRLFTPAELGSRTVFLNKRAAVPVFCQVVSQVAGYRARKDVWCFPPENDGLPLPTLTLRETLVLTELMEGRSLRQIAGLYHNSLKTISSHKRRAMKKLGVSSNAQLLTLLHALSHGDGGARSTAAAAE